MLSFLPGILRGILSVLSTTLNTTFWIIWLIPVAIIKFTLPFQPVRKVCDIVLNWICTTWANVNKFDVDLFINPKWELDMPDDLSLDKWYLIISNHQSWSDILVLQYVFNAKVPYFRFFLKSQLKWFPLLNIAWWALDYPFMVRYSKEYLEKNPHMKGKDMETTRKSCAKFKHIPVSIMNFVEGTRFKPDRHKKQNSPYKNLLRPNAGGIAFVLGAMGNQLTSILDVTIAYPYGALEMWDFFCGKVPLVRVKVTPIELSDDIIGDYFNDEDFKKRFQGWLNDLWTKKDKLVEEMRKI